MQQQVEAGRDQQQFINYSLDNLRVFSTNGHLPPPTNETRDHINTIVQSYFESSLYREFIEDFTKTAETIEPNRSKIETSFKEGLIKNLRAVNYYLGEIKNKNFPEISRIIQGFTLHCNRTLENIINIPQANKCLPAFHSTIQSPHLLDSDLLKQLLLQISDNSYLSYLSINQLFTNSTKNIKTVIVQKTESFEKLKNYNQEHQLGLSTSAMRLLVTCYANPFDHINKQTIPITKSTILERPKRPYHRHIIPNVTDKNPTQKTVAQAQPQTTEITSKPKRPYHRHQEPEGLSTETKPKRPYHRHQDPSFNTSKKPLIRDLSQIEVDLKEGRMNLSDLADLKPIIFRLHDLLQPIITRPEKITTPKIPISEYLDKLPTKKSLRGKTTKEIIEEYQRTGHEFLNEPTIRFYLDKDNFAQKIEEGLVLYDSLSQQFTDRQTSLLKQVISEVIKHQLLNPSAHVNVYLNLRERYPNIPESTFFGIVTPYIFKEKIDTKTISNKLIEESKKW